MIKIQIWPLFMYGPITHFFGPSNTTSTWIKRTVQRWTLFTAASHESGWSNCGHFTIKSTMLLFFVIVSFPDDISLSTNIHIVRENMNFRCICIHTWCKTCKKSCTKTRHICIWRLFYFLINQIWSHLHDKTVITDTSISSTRRGED